MDINELVIEATELINDLTDDHSIAGDDHRAFIIELTKCLLDTLR